MSVIHLLSDMNTEHLILNTHCIDQIDTKIHLWMKRVNDSEERYVLRLTSETRTRESSVKKNADKIILHKE